MSAIISDLSFVPMARKEQASRTEQANFRLKATTIERLETYKLRHPLHPTLTMIVEAAIIDWLDAHERELPPPKPKGR